MNRAASAPSPDQIMGAMNGFQVTGALLAGIELDLFTAIASGADSVSALAARCDAAPRGVRILADSLTVFGLLRKHADRYSLGEAAAAFLDRRQPGYLGDTGRFFASRQLLRQFLDDPAGWVRRGGAENLANTAPENPLWVEFAEGMAPLMAPVAKQVAALLRADDPQPRRILDIAAGHGLFGIEIARDNSAEVSAVDWAPVLAVARANAAAAGMEERLQALPGSAFDVFFGDGYDTVLLANFLHHFDPPACVALLRKIRASMLPQGRLAIVEFIPNEDRVSPPAPALFALSMLAGTPAGDAYTAAEIESLCRQAGFSAPTFTPLPPSSQTLALARADAVI